ncbi:MAG TPA: DUF4831 family protein [Bacteroidaceae bacterium]|nr:DUF4831 family protein [Bacteroidaceae bacterium]
MKKSLYHTKLVLLSAGLMITSTLGQFLHAQDPVSPYDIVARGKKYGIYYNLPYTNIQITFHATKTVYTPGELNLYGERYLHIRGIASVPSTKWHLDKVTAQIVGIADTARSYFVELRSKSAPIQIQMADNGCIWNINFPLIKESNEETPSPKKAIQTYNPQSAMTQEILMATSKIRRAELVADEIFSIRDSRNELTRGQADYMPTEGDALKLMLERLDLQEKTLTSLFTGTTTTSEVSKIYTVTPKDNLETIICRFSSKLGFVDSDDLSGAPIVLSLTDLHRLPDGIADDKESEKLQAKLSRKKPLSGIAYNVPGQGLCTIKLMGQNILEQEFPITQFGTIEFLAPVLFEKKRTIQVLFAPETGSLIKIYSSEKDK